MFATTSAHMDDPSYQPPHGELDDTLGRHHEEESPPQHSYHDDNGPSNSLHAMDSGADTSTAAVDHQSSQYNSVAQHGLSAQEEQMFAADAVSAAEHGQNSGDKSSDDRSFDTGGSSSILGNSGGNTNSVNNKNARFAVQWLQSSFAPFDGAHIAREVLYQQYCDHCMHHARPPMNSASFGKIIRAVFPCIATRRLGTRGNSKYHYYGIKPTAENTANFNVIIKDAPRSTKFKICPTSGNPIISPLKRNVDQQPRRVAPSEETLSQLLRLPPVDAATMPMGVDVERVQEFFQLYRVHCHDVLSSGLQGHFTEFGEAIISFWKGLSEELFQVVECRETCRAVYEWDAVLFQSMLTVFLPDILSPGDKFMMKELRNFTKQLPVVLAAAFDGRHEAMFAEKSRVAHDFNKIVKQYYHLNQLALNADHVATQHAVMDSMIGVWSELDFDSILAQSVYVCSNAGEALRLVQENVYSKLEAKANVMKWAEWIFAITEEFLGGDIQSYEEYTYFAQQFIIRWHYIASLIMRDIGERSKEYFVPFHYIRLFCDEYVKYLIDCKLDEKRRQLDSSSAIAAADVWGGGAHAQVSGGHSGAFATDIFSHPFDVSAHDAHHSISTHSGNHSPAMFQFQSTGQHQQDAVAMPRVNCDDDGAHVGNKAGADVPVEAGGVKEVSDSPPKVVASTADEDSSANCDDADKK